MPVYVLGGTGLDLLAQGLPRLPEADVAGDEFTPRSLVALPKAPRWTIGGNAGNLAYVLARLGGAAHLVTPLADDPPGRLVRGWLADAGCGLTVLPGAAATSFNFVATSAGRDRHSFFLPVPPPAEAAVKAVRRLPLGPPDHLVVAGYPHLPLDALQACLETAREAGAGTALDVGPALAGFRLAALAPLLPHLDLLFCNRDELRALDAGRAEVDLADALRNVLRGGLVRKEGREGATLFRRDGTWHADAFDVPAPSTVGAGDAFDAAFLLRRAVEQAPPDESLRFAAAAVALMLKEGRGTLGAPSRAAVERSAKDEVRSSSGH